jgi:phosphatidylinositol alpha-1,6-mannosyltransferase
VRILAVTNDYPPEIGGIGSYIFELYRRLPDQGIDVRVLAPAMPGDGPFDASAGLDVVRYPTRLVRSSRSLTATVREMSQDRDLITLGSTLPMGFAATRTGLPVLLHTHNSEIYYDRFPGTRWLLRRLIAQTAHVTVLTSYTGRALAGAIGDHPMTKLSPAVDLDRFHPDLTGAAMRERFGIPLDRPLIVHAGRLVPRKGQDVLIAAMPSIRAAIPGATLLVIGSGPYERRLRRVAKEHGLAEDAVRFGGPVRWDELPEVYAAADVFATPCRARYGGREVEGFGQVFLEAQAAGKPVIVGNSGGAPETTIDGSTGFLVEAEDVPTIAARVIELLGDRALAATMGLAGRRHVEERFCWDDRAAAFGELLRGLAARRAVA